MCWNAPDVAAPSGFSPRSNRRKRSAKSWTVSASPPARLPSPRPHLATPNWNGRERRPDAHPGNDANLRSPFSEGVIPAAPLCPHLRWQSSRAPYRSGKTAIGSHFSRPHPLLASSVHLPHRISLPGAAEFPHTHTRFTGKKASYFVYTHVIRTVLPVTFLPHIDIISDTIIRWRRSTNSCRG